MLPRSYRIVRLNWKPVRYVGQSRPVNKEASARLFGEKEDIPAIMKMLARAYNNPALLDYTIITGIPARSR